MTAPTTSRVTTAADPAPRRGLAMVVLIFASFMDLMDATVVNVALPAIDTHLHASPAQLEWIVGGYTLTFAVLLITGGRLGDIYGRQRLFLVGVGGFTLASLVAALAPDAAVLVGARLAQGGLAALMIPQVLASVQALYPPKQRAPMLGVIGAVAGLAAVVGPLVGGALVTADAFGLQWRSIFVINLPVGIALFAAALAWVPNTRSPHPLSLDPVGVACVTLALGLLVFPLVEGQQLGWPSWIWWLFAGALVALAGFVAQQRRRERTIGSPLVPLRLFTRPGFSAGVVTQFLFFGAMVGFSLILTLYLQLGLHFSAIAAGLVLLPFSIASFLASMAAVPLAGRLGKPLVFLGAALQAAAVLWVRAIVAAEGTGLGQWSLWLPMALAGIGLGILVIPLADLALAHVPATDAGAGSGVFNTFQQVGGVLGIALAGVVFFSRADAAHSLAAMQDALLAAALVPVAGHVLAALCSLALPASSAGAAHAAAELADDPA